MSKSIVSKFVFILFVFSGAIFAQDSFSLQATGGLVMPVHSQKGAAGLVQFNYPLNSNTNLYFYSGYASWDQDRVTFFEEANGLQKQQNYSSYSTESHVLIPAYVGINTKLHTNNLFSLYVNFETGYSHLSYNTYANAKKIDPATGVVLAYYADQSTKKEVNENLLAFGIGASLSRPLMENLNLVVSFKLNSYVNSNYSGFLGSSSTYTILLAGLNFGI